MRRHTPWERQFVRAAALFDLLGRPFMTIELDAPEPLPDEPVLLAANHRSLVDVFVAIICCVRMGRPTRLIVGRSFFKRPGMGWFLRTIGCIVGGKGSGADKVAIDAIGAGTTCAIMPEGAISTMEPGHVLAPLLPGVANIWATTGCPFVAVAITGAGEVWKDGHNLPQRPRLRRAHRPVVHVRVLPAIRPGDEPVTLERVFEIMEDNCRRSEADRLAALARRAGAGG